jgi:hypothetical protein
MIRQSAGGKTMRQLDIWSAIGRKTGIHFSGSRFRFRMRSAPEPVKLQFDNVCRFRISIRI